MYLYPDNLKGKPILWLWYLRDIGIIGIGAIFSVICISQAGFYLPVSIVGCYAFLTIRFQDTSIYDFLKYACSFFILQQQSFTWSYTTSRVLEESIIKRNQKKSFNDSIEKLMFWKTDVS